MRLGIYVHPGGIVYADRQEEKNGDYVTIGFLSFYDGSLQIYGRCPKILIKPITEHAQQFTPGQTVQISWSGQTTIIGGY